MESMLSWWSLLESEQNFWQISVPSGLFIVHISLVMLQLLRRNRKEADTDADEFTEAESFLRQLRATMALVQEAQEGHCARFQNVMDLAKTIMARNEHLSQLQNQMGLMEAMKAEGEHRAQIQRETNSLKMVVERWLSVPTEQMLGYPASMESPLKMKTLRKSYTVASNAAAEKRRKFRTARSCEFGTTPKRQSSEIQDRVLGQRGLQT
jgi:hypothetical protein